VAVSDVEPSVPHTAQSSVPAAVRSMLLASVCDTSAVSEPETAAAADAQFENSEVSSALSVAVAV
jgi:hypothetical protein